jgi:hypothetical protein
MANRKDYRVNSLNSLNASRDAPLRRLGGVLGTYAKASLFTSKQNENKVVCSYVIVVIIQENSTASSYKTTIYSFILGGRPGRWWLGAQAYARGASLLAFSEFKELIR